MCSGAGGTPATPPPQYQVSPQGAGAADATSRSPRPVQPPFKVPRGPAAPPPGRPRPPRQGNPRTPGRGAVHTVYLLLWESREHRACHTSKAEGQQGHFSGGFQLEDAATQGGKGSTPLLGAASEGASPPTTGGGAEAGAGGVPGPGPQGRGREGPLSTRSPHRRDLNAGTDAPLGTSASTARETGVQTRMGLLPGGSPSPSPPSRGTGAAGGLLLQTGDARSLGHAPSTAQKAPRPAAPSGVRWVGPRVPAHTGGRRGQGRPRPGSPN